MYTKNRRPPPGSGTLSEKTKGLFPQVEPVQDFFIILGIFSFEVFQKLAHLAYKLEKTMAGMMVLLVDFEVVGQKVDPLREDSYLDRSRACVFFILFEGIYQALFCFSCNRHQFTSQYDDIIS